MKFIPLKLIGLFFIIFFIFSCKCDKPHSVDEGDTSIDTIVYKSNLGVVKYVDDTIAIAEHLILKEAVSFAPEDFKVGNTISYLVNNENAVVSLEKVTLSHHNKYWHDKEGLHNKAHITGPDAGLTTNNEKYGGENSLQYGGKNYVLKNFEPVDDKNLPIINSEVFQAWISKEDIKKIKAKNNYAYVGFLQTDGSISEKKIQNFKIAVEVLLIHPKH